MTEPFLFTGSQDGAVRVMDRKSAIYLLDIGKHKSFVYAIWEDESRLYTGSFDKTIRIWDVPLCEMPPYFKKPMAFGTVFENALEFIDKKDLFGRTALMASAISGCLSNAEKFVSLKSGSYVIPRN